MEKAIICFICFICFKVGAQQLQGTIVDSFENPISYANVILLNSKDSILAKGVITNEDGKFIINNMSRGQYTLSISYIGYETYLQELDFQKSINLGKIIITENNIALEETVISVIRPKITLKNNAIIVKVDDILAKGNNGLDILSKAPNVFVGSDGNIRLIGKTNVKIFLNDRLVESNSLNSLLTSLNAENIDEIEIINNPTSRFDANYTGGIINIKLKKSVPGFKGDISLTTSKGELFKSRNSLNLIYGLGNLNFYSNYAYSKNNSFEKTKEENVFNTVPSTILNQTTDAIISGETQFLRIGSDYTFGTNTISLLLTGKLYKESIPQKNQTSLFQNDFQSNSVTLNQSDNNRNDYYFNLNYTKYIDTLKSNLSFDIQHTNFIIRSKSLYQTFFENAELDEILNSKNPNNSKIISIQSIFTKIFNDNNRLQLGYKYSDSRINNEIDFSRLIDDRYINDPLLSTKFKYIENINSVFAEYSGKINTKTQYLIGFRFERTNIERTQDSLEKIKNNYTDFFPSLNLNHQFSKKHQVSFSFSRKIDRPKYNNLNSYIYYVDPYTTIRGNPNLKPQYVTNYNLDYLFNSKYYFSIFYNYIKDVFLQVPIQDIDDISIVLQENNLKYSKQYGISLSIPYESSWFRSNTNILIYNKKFKYGKGLFENLSNQKNVLEFSQSNTFILTKSFYIDLSGYYVSPFVEGVYEKKEVFSASLGLRKSFFNDALNLKVIAHDIFNTYKLVSLGRIPNQTNTLSQRFDTQRISFNVVYNFSQGSNVNINKAKEINSENAERL